ncbi:MAG: glycoside hydrolase 100 family protein [Planctomycetota bacterium]|jgi:hypothetical protein
MIKRRVEDEIAEAKQAALEVLLNNRRGSYQGLPRAAAWGYPEPYTRDLLISAFGYLVAGSDKLIDDLRRVLQALAKNQTRLGHIPSLAHDPNDRGASDTTPLFLMILALYRKVTGDSAFLDESVSKALRWMEYQSPDDLIMVAQQPTSDWRDEHWVLGYGLYVNTIVYAYLCLWGKQDEARSLKALMNRFDIRGTKRQRHVHEGLVVRNKPYYALWSFKMDNNERFDLLGNSLAILTGIASPSRARDMVTWIEAECDALRSKDELADSLPPCLFPYIKPGDPDWRLRYEQFNQPGEYHNGGIWPFICGFYVVALVAAGRIRLAEQKLHVLTQLIRRTNKAQTAYGFNEWFKAQDGNAKGQDWQTWSAAMYLYAVTCVESKTTPFFDVIRQVSSTAASKPKEGPTQSIE